jgi:predicted ester cyclase
MSAQLPAELATVNALEASSLRRRQAGRQVASGYLVRVGWSLTQSARELFRRLPNLRFEVEDMIIEGGPRSTRVATRYAATRNGKVVYRGRNFGRVVWGKVVEERILPDTAALAAALA